MTDLANNSQSAAATQRPLAALLEIRDVRLDQPGRLTRPTAIRIAILTALFCVLHYEQINWMARSWASNVNWNHGFMLPLFSLFLLYTRREDIYATPRKAFWPGLALMVLAFVLEVLAFKLVQNYWLLCLSMVLMLFALVLFVGGWRLIRVVWLPILFLMLAVPLPDTLYNRLAYPLQEVAASGAMLALKLFGVDIVREASNLKLVSRSYATYDLTVAEACSGMRLLMAFFALGVAMAYLESRPIWQRAILVAAGIPIAVFCNILRVAITSTMYYIDKPELGKGLMHTLTGILMLLPAFALLFLLSWLMGRLFVEDKTPAAASAESPVGEGKA